LKRVLHETCQQYIIRRLSEGWRIISQIGFNVVLQSPEGIIRPVDLRNDVKTLRPNAPGSYTELFRYPNTGEANWEDVDEEVADDGATYVGCGTLLLEKRDTYNLSSYTGTGTINSVTVYYRCCSYNPGTPQAWAVIVTHGVKYRSAAWDALSGWTLYSKTWSTNPYTGSAWTPAEINDLEAGVEFLVTTSDNEALCTQVYVEVNYTPPTPAWKDVATRFKLSAQGYRDVATRFKLTVQAFKDTATRLKLWVRAYQDVATRFRLLIGTFGNQQAFLTFVNYFIDVATRFRLTVQAYQNIATRFKLWVRGYRDIATRFKLIVQAYKDVATRFKLTVLNYKDIATRFRLNLPYYQDIATRFKLWAQGYQDIVTRFKLTIQAYQDIATRFKLTIYTYKDIATRFRLSVPAAYQDIATRFFLYQPTWKELQIQAEIVLLKSKVKPKAHFEI